MEYRLLGTLEVRDGDRSLPLAGAKQRALLALLLVNANHVVSRERLIDELWGDDPPETAVQSVQVYVSRLRKLLPSGTLVTRPPGYLLEIEPSDLDLRCFERLLADGHEALAKGNAERAGRVLREALELWRGPALAEFAFEPFAQAEIGRLADLRLGAVEERIEADLALGRHADVIGELEALIAENPFRERLRGELMLALYRSDRQAEALEAYQAARRALVGELGIEPSAVLQRLEKAILTQEPALEAPATRSTGTVHQANLPASATRFVDRERELTEVRELLAREDVRLLTLTGPGGTGKTRLALQAATDAAEDYEHGVWWVPLAPLRDPALVVEEAARLLGAQQDLSRHIDDKHLLLLFDNFEQVVRAGSDVAELVAACPRLDVLVTSREPLHVAGEQEYAVPPLREPEAVELFQARARAAIPDFGSHGAISEICRRLDNLPLAIELAAARVIALSPDQILERLEQRLPLLTRGQHNVPKRQRTLTATIDWSYELLSEEEQRLFRRLAVFAGGCTLEAAEDVAKADLETLQSLVEKSLVRHTGERYWMLETIHEYALGRLWESGEAEELLRLHVEFYVRLAEDGLLRPKSAEVLSAIDDEKSNLRAALSYCADGREPQLMLRLAGASWGYWNARDLWKEGCRWLEEAVERRDGSPPVVQARALRGLAAMTQPLGDHARTLTLLEEALELSRQVDDDDGLARCLNNLGALVDWEEEPDRAAALLEESLALSKRLAERGPGVAVMLINLAHIAELRGDFVEGRRLAGDSLAAARVEEKDVSAVDALETLAWLDLFERRHDTAVQHANEALQIMLGIRVSTDTDSVLVAVPLYASRGNPDDAARLVGATFERDRRLGLPRLGLPRESGDDRIYSRRFAALQKEMGHERFDALCAEGAALSPEEVRELVARALD